MSLPDPRIVSSLNAARARVADRGALLSPDRLKECLAVFRERFGPARLKALDGVDLLHVLHATGDPESLVYWLEFKNDEEFPGAVFGSISGGSAHKFGLFRRKHTSQWVRGTAREEENISEAEAVKTARAHRDQLLKGAALLEKLPAAADDATYAKLQEALSQLAPEAGGQAWRHKYFSLLFPDRLDDCHHHRWQRFHLIKMLQVPPALDGLYACAGRFVRLAEELGWPLNHLTAALNERNGRPNSYWRIATQLTAEQSIWPEMLAGGYAAIGWPELGDISSVFAGADPMEKIAGVLRAEHGSDSRLATRNAVEICNFAWFMAVSDLILAAEGERILGVGRITGPYRFDPTAPTEAPHRRDVEWLSTTEWSLPVKEGLQTTVWALRKDERNLVAVEKHLLELLPAATASTAPSVAEPPPSSARRERRLEGIPGRLQSLLERKGQIILHGSPGTGKTFLARKLACDLAALAAYGTRFEHLSPEQVADVTGDNTKIGLVRCCAIHPTVGYEEFIERRVTSPGPAMKAAPDPRTGVFKRICQDAAADPERDYFLVLDEIDRGDLRSLLGETVTLLEPDKRNLSITLPVSGESFFVPRNVFIVATWNTLNRPISELDVSLRRRFGLFELLPDPSVLGEATAGGAIRLDSWLHGFNARVREQSGQTAAPFQTGHAYLIGPDGKPLTDLADFARAVVDDILPLFDPSFREERSQLVGILEGAISEAKCADPHQEAFSLERTEKLIRALRHLATPPQSEIVCQSPSPQNGG